MYKTLNFFRARTGMSELEFRHYYETVHVPLVLRRGEPPILYRRNYVLRADSDPVIATGAFDVMTELGFADKAAYLDWSKIVDADQEVAADELRLFDPNTCRPIRTVVVQEQSS